MVIIFFGTFEDKFSENFKSNQILWFSCSTQFTIHPTVQQIHLIHVLVMLSYSPKTLNLCVEMSRQHTAEHKIAAKNKTNKNFTQSTGKVIFVEAYVCMHVYMCVFVCVSAFIAIAMSERV